MGTARPALNSPVLRQGTWLFLATLANGALGFLFWTVAARSFPPDLVGLTAAIISLALLAASIGIMGLDSGLIRFIHDVRRPRRLIGQLAVLSGLIAGVAGFLLGATILSASQVAVTLMAPLLALSTVIAVTLVWLQLSDAAFLSAERSRLIMYRSVAFGAGKLLLVLLLVSFGVVGLLLAYALPPLVIVALSFGAIWLLWPPRRVRAGPYRLRDFAFVSSGNWASAFFWSLPNRVAPPLILLVAGAEPVSFFFISMALAEMLHYIPASMGKSMFAHGSQVGRLDPALRRSVGRLLALIMVPLVVVGVLLSPLAMTLVGGPAYGQHAVSLQLFFLAVLPRSGLQLLRARFNVEGRISSLVAVGALTGLSTLAVFLLGVALGWSVDLLPVAWVVGAALSLGVGVLLARRKALGSEVLTEESLADRTADDG